MALQEATILFFKGAFTVFALLYFVFSLVVVRQVQLMTGVVKTEAGVFLRTVAIIHAILSLGVILVFISLF